MSPRVTNTRILAPLRLLKEDEDALSQATQAVVRQVRGKNENSMDDTDFVRELAKKWLREHNKSYLEETQSKLEWPKDAEKLIKIISDLMSLQNLRRTKKEAGSHKQPVQPKEMKRLEMWPERRSKRTRTVKDTDQTTYSDNLSSSTTLPSGDENLDVDNFSEHSRSFFLPQVEKNADHHTEHTRLNDTSVLGESAEQDARRSPPQFSRAREQFEVASPTPNRTISLAPSLESPIDPVNKHAPITPPSRTERESRTSSDCTIDYVDEATFKIDCNGKTYDLLGQKCVNVLQLTLSLLEQMRADLRVAMLQGKRLDNQVKVAYLLDQIEMELRR